jgi:protein-disulfide isomerase
MSRDNGSIFEVPADGPATFGPERAPLTVVGYCSLEDRSCAILLPKLQWLGEKYPSKVRVVWKSAASCAGAGSDALTELAFEVRRSKSKTAFWQALTELAKEHAHAGAVSTPGEHDLRRLAAAVGISPERARLVIQDRPYVQSIDVDADSSLDLQAICAPHVFINGKHLVSVDSAALMAAVDVELQKTLQKTAMTKGGVEFYRPVERPLPAGLPPNDPSRGNADAPVVVHEFCTYDYACAGADAMLVRVMHDFGDRVRVVWHDVAAPKMLAAMAAREAYAQKGAVAFFSVHDRILGGTLAPTRADLDRFAQDLHLDMNLWKAALDDGSRDAELAADWNAVSDGPMRTTPAWLVTHRGAQSGYSLDASATRPELRWAIRTVLRTHAK